MLSLGSGAGTPPTLPERNSAWLLRRARVSDSAPKIHRTKRSVDVTDNRLDVAPGLKETHFVNKSDCKRAARRAAVPRGGLEGSPGPRKELIFRRSLGGANFGVLFSELPLEASVEMAADGPHQKCILLFICRSLQKPGSPGTVEIKVHFYIVGTVEAQTLLGPRGGYFILFPPLGFRITPS